MSYEENRRVLTSEEFANTIEIAKEKGGGDNITIAAISDY